MRRALPKPGAWMDTLKQIFAFPIYASAAWLLWVLAQEASSLGLGAALAGAILIALAAWAYQKSRSGSAGSRVAGLVTAALGLLIAILLPVRFADVAAASPASLREPPTPRMDGCPTMPPKWPRERRGQASAGELHRQLVPDLFGE